MLKSTHTENNMCLLVRIRPHTLLVELLRVLATLENHLAASQNADYGGTI